MTSPQEPSREEWEKEFYELTATMDGQYRPKLKVLISDLLAKERERQHAKTLGAVADTFRRKFNGFGGTLGFTLSDLLAALKKP